MYNNTHVQQTAQPGGIHLTSRERETSDPAPELITRSPFSISRRTVAALSHTQHAAHTSPPTQLRDLDSPLTGRGLSSRVNSPLRQLSVNINGSQSPRSHANSQNGSSKLFGSATGNGIDSSHIPRGSSVRKSPNMTVGLFNLWPSTRPAWWFHPHSKYRLARLLARINPYQLAASLLAIVLLICLTYLHYFPIRSGWYSAPGYGPTAYNYHLQTLATDLNHDSNTQWRQRLHEPNTDVIDSTVMTGSKSLLILTACNANHFESLQFMLYSLRELSATVIFYDLGITPQQHNELIRWQGLTVRTFHFDEYPPHVNVEVAAGQYAWKPIIIHTVMTEILMKKYQYELQHNQVLEAPNVLWIDAGAYFLDTSLIRHKIHSSASGVYVGRSWGTVKHKTHPGMYEYLGADYNAYGDKGNCEAGMAGFRVETDLYNQVVQPWKQCAEVAACISPPGSSRKNHRQDQSALTYLLHKNEIAIVPQDDRVFMNDGVKTKCDRTFYGWLPTYPCLHSYAWFCMV